MPFSDKLKLEVKQKSAFKCCICQETCADIHHIISESEGGPNTIENAAPLCKKCHDIYGGNPDKRKLIKECRDWWYEKCSELYSNPQFYQFKETLEKINENLEAINKNQPDIKEFKSLLLDLVKKMTITPSTAPSIVSNIIDAYTIKNRTYKGYYINVYVHQIGKGDEHAGEFFISEISLGRFSNDKYIETPYTIDEPKFYTTKEEAEEMAYFRACQIINGDI